MLDNIPATTNDILCEICSSPIFPKNNDSTKRFPVKYLRYTTLCQTCYNAEKSIIESNKVEPILQGSLESIVNKREDYFNAERTDLALIEGSPFERILAIRDRITKWSDLLFEVRTRQESAQSLLNELAQKITAEERGKLKISDLSYNSVAVTPGPKKPRVSAEDKSINSMVKALFGKAISTGTMTEDEGIKKVKEIVRNSKNITFTKMAEGSLRCTCAETPGICRIHSAE